MGENGGNTMQTCCASHVLEADGMLFEHLSEPESSRIVAHIPANVREFASKHGVGAPLTHYRSKRLLFEIVRAAVQTMMFSVGTGFLVKGYIDGLILDRTYPLPNTNHIEQLFQNTQQIILWVIVGLALCAIVSSMGFWRYYRAYRQDVLYLCQNGLLRLGKNKEESLLWSAVADLFGRGDSGLVLHREDGTRFVVSEPWSSNKELNTQIVHMVTERLLPRLIERFEQGVPLSFGTLLIVSTGIRYGKELVLWSDVEDVQNRNGVLVVKSKRKEQSFTSILGNTALIMALVKHVMRTRLVVVLRNCALRSREMALEANE